jgi:hypothetical protein
MENSRAISIIGNKQYIVSTDYRNAILRPVELHVWSSDVSYFDDACSGI